MYLQYIYGALNKVRILKYVVALDAKKRRYKERKFISKDGTWRQNKKSYVIFKKVLNFRSESSNSKFLL